MDYGGLRVLVGWPRAYHCAFVANKCVRLPAEGRLTRTAVL